MEPCGLTAHLSSAITGVLICP